MTARPRLAVVVPVYGNEPSLSELYERVTRAADEAGADLTLQFVNDRSPDNSQAALEALAARDPRVRVILLSRNHGSFVAIAAGLAQVADHDAAVILSADLQDPPETIPLMVKRWREGKKVVLCVRSRREDPWPSRLFSEAFHGLFRRVALKDMPPGGFDFCLIDKAVVRVILQSGEKKTSLVGLILWAGFDRAVVEYERAARKHGKSMWSFGRKLSYAFHSIVAFSSFPMKVFGLAGLALGGLSLVAMAYVAVAHAMGLISAPGWASMMLAQLVTITTVLLGFAVVGGYLWINLEQTRKRPLFIIEKRVGFPDKAELSADSEDLFPRGRSKEARTLQAGVGRPPEGALAPTSSLERFERGMADLFRAGHCVGVASGTDALTLALMAAVAGGGARVAVPALGDPAVAVAVLRAGCVPVFVDVDPVTLAIDPDGLEGAAALGASAVVAARLFGVPCPMGRIGDAARGLGLTVVELWPQAAGGANGEEASPLSGAASAFCFAPGDWPGARGLGGAVLTSDAGLAAKLALMRSMGLDASGECVSAGLDSRLDGRQAALLAKRLDRLAEHDEARRRIAAIYDREIPFLNPVGGGERRAPVLYAVRPPMRDSFRAAMLDRGVGTSLPCPLPLNRHAHFVSAGLGGPCPRAEKAAPEVVALPCHPAMGLEDVLRVTRACLDWRARAGV
jgi:dolichol-phosphate mannosyltransferase